MCVVSPIKALKTLNRAVCQFFGIDPEFRLLGQYPGLTFLSLLTNFSIFPLFELLWLVIGDPAIKQNTASFLRGYSQTSECTGSASMDSTNLGSKILENKVNIVAEVYYVVRSVLNMYTLFFLVIP